MLYFWVHLEADTQKKSRATFSGTGRWPQLQGVKKNWSSYSCNPPYLQVLCWFLPNPQMPQDCWPFTNLSCSDTSWTQVSVGEQVPQDSSGPETPSEEQWSRSGPYWNQRDILGTRRTRLGPLSLWKHSFFWDQYCLGMYLLCESQVMTSILYIRAGTETPLVGVCEGGVVKTEC